MGRRGADLRLGLRGKTRDAMTTYAVTIDANRIGGIGRTGFSASPGHRF